MSDFDQVSFTVNAIPVSYARPRYNGKTKKFYDDKKYRLGKTTIAMAAIPYKQMVVPDGPVAMTMIFYMGEPPMSWTQKKRDAVAEGGLAYKKKPDLDNLVKSVLDALNGNLFHDDAQVVRVDAMKTWGSPARSEIILDYIKEEAP